MTFRFLGMLALAALLVVYAPGVSNSQQGGEDPARFRSTWNRFAQAYNEQTRLLAGMSELFPDDPTWKKLVAVYNEQTDLIVEIREQFNIDPPEHVQSLEVLEKMRRALVLNKKCRVLMGDLIRIQFNVKIEDK